MPVRLRKACLHLCRYFSINGRTGDQLITEGQLRIFAAIVFRLKKFVEIICYTQYGKSLWVALACIIVACIQGKIVAVVAPSNEKAKIIMRYFIEHLGDSPLFYGQLEKNTRLERLRQEESKERIILRNGGGIFVLSVQQKNIAKSIEAAMGAGAEVVIIDEACLIQDDTESTVFRMVTGKTINGEGDILYCKIGNPFYSQSPNSHFKTDWENPIYAQIFIDVLQGLAEGRITQELVDIAKTKPLFGVLYDCEFPPEDEIDFEGFRKLVVSEKIRYNKEAKALVKKQIERERELKRLINEEVKKSAVERSDKKINEWQEELKKIPRTKLGGDIGGGGDHNAFVIRKGPLAFIAAKNKSSDTMVNVSEVERLIVEYDILDEDINIDDIGIGRGVSDRLKELGHSINGVSWGDPAKDSETFFNLKAELFWTAKIWLEGEGELEKDDKFLQITWIKYKTHTGERRVQMEPKEKLRHRMKQSPDFADAFALTFYEAPFIGIL